MMVTVWWYNCDIGFCGKVVGTKPLYCKLSAPFETGADGGCEVTARLGTSRDHWSICSPTTFQVELIEGRDTKTAYGKSFVLILNRCTSIHAQYCILNSIRSVSQISVLHIIQCLCIPSVSGIRNTGDIEGGTSLHVAGKVEAPNCGLWMKAQSGDHALTNQGLGEYPAWAPARVHARLCCLRSPPALYGPPPKSCRFSAPPRPRRRPPQSFDCKCATLRNWTCSWPIDINSHEVDKPRCRSGVSFPIEEVFLRAVILNNSQVYHRRPIDCETLTRLAGTEKEEISQVRSGKSEQL